MEKIIAGKTILLNTKTNCTFIATDFDVKHTGKHESHLHIEWSGELDINAHDNVPIGNAMTSLKKALDDDPEYKEGWIANIAMAFKDEYSRHDKKDIHKISNNAAINFLKQLTF